MTTTTKKTTKEAVKDVAKKAPAGKSQKATAMTGEKARPKGKMVGVDAAARVLAESGKPMTVAEIVSTMRSRRSGCTNLICLRVRPLSGPSGRHLGLGHVGRELFRSGP